MGDLVPETRVKDSDEAREMAGVEEKQRQIAKEALEIAFDAYLHSDSEEVKPGGDLTDPQRAKDLLLGAGSVLREAVDFRGFGGSERWRGGENKTELEKRFKVGGQGWVCNLYPFSQEGDLVGQNIKFFKEGESSSDAEYGFYVVFEPGIDVWKEYYKGKLHETKVVVKTYSGGRRDPRSSGNDVTVKINREVKPRETKLESKRGF